MPERPEGPERSVIVDSDGPDETAALARVVAGSVQGGDLIVLSGDLGAGKTTFTKAFAAALGVTAPVTSPTFTLANRYVGDLVVNHLDAYRIGGLDEVIDLGLDELVTADAVTLIEWGDSFAPALPIERLEIGFAHGDIGDADDQRRVTITASGDGWRSRLATVNDALRAEVG